MGSATILIFEPLSGGHRENFIRCLRDTVPDFPGCRFVFFTADDAGDLSLETLGWWQKQKRLYDLFRQACRKYKPAHVLILELTRLELPLLLFGSPVALSAILFVQYPEIPKGWKNAFKHWKTRLLLACVRIENLFLLNGEKACEFLAAHFGPRTRFIPIPDPVPVATPDPGFVIRDVYGIAPDRTVFLFFGAVSKRKGAHVLLEALRMLDSHTLSRSTFLFCGKPEAAYQTDFQKAVAEVADLGSVDIRVDARFIPDEQLAALFEQSDVVLMPYTRPDYSSGILGLAAAAGVPVIGPDAGLPGRLIRENGLGRSLVIEPPGLAAAIKSATEAPLPVDRHKQRLFVEKSGPDNFASLILNAVTESI